MSTDLAFSETTPLRPSEFNNDCIVPPTSFNVTNETSVTTINSRYNHGDRISNNNNNNVINQYNNTLNSNLNNTTSNNSINNTLNNIPTQQIGTTTTTTINNNSGVQQFETTIGGCNSPTNSNGLKNNKKSFYRNFYKIGSKMETNRKIVCKIITDFTILLCVGLPILLFYLFGEPYKRGFFCDDESLKHPFHESTVKNYMLYMIGVALPLSIMIPTECFLGRKIASPSFRFMNYDIPSWMVQSYKQIGVFAFGACCQQLIVDIAKYQIGRLRPHFLEVCQPIMPDNSRCNDPINIGKYIEEFTCENENSTPRMIKEMRLSFPSGHASFSAFTMIYCIIYIQARMDWRGSKLLKHFIQFLLFAITWFTALSRISDYKHHWSDVMAGGFIGIIFAIIVAKFAADFSPPKYVLPTTHHDINTNLHTTPNHHQQQYSTTNNHQQPNSHQNGHNHT